MFKKICAVLLLLLMSSTAFAGASWELWTKKTENAEWQKIHEISKAEPWPDTIIPFCSPTLTDDGPYAIKAINKWSKKLLEANCDQALKEHNEKSQREHQTRIERSKKDNKEKIKLW